DAAGGERVRQVAVQPGLHVGALQRGGAVGGRGRARGGRGVGGGRRVLGAGGQRRRERQQSCEESGDGTHRGSPPPQRAGWLEVTPRAAAPRGSPAPRSPDLVI